MRRCLIIDDVSVIRKVARQIIGSLKYEIEEAETGQEALELCRAEMPDVVLLDWQLPGSTATEFLSALRLMPGGKRPFVLYCTTENDPVDISRALGFGADDYLLKPFDRESIEAKFGEIKVVA